MGDDSDVHEHLRKFFDTIDKLNEIDVDINPDLLTIMLLYSFRPSFENFRCAIESRDELPTPEALRVKIIEENDARKNVTQTVSTNAMVAKKQTTRYNTKRKNETGAKNNYKNQETSKSEPFKYRCHRCHKIGHKIADYRSIEEDK